MPKFGDKFRVYSPKSDGSVNENWWQGKHGRHAVSVRPDTVYVEGWGSVAYNDKRFVPEWEFELLSHDNGTAENDKPQYQVGQRVALTQDWPGIGRKKGDIGTVIHAREKSSMVQWADDVREFHNEWLRPLDVEDNNPKKSSLPKFKLYDRVVLNTDFATLGFAKGDTGIVTDNNTRNEYGAPLYRIKFDGRDEDGDWLDFHGCHLVSAPEGLSSRAVKLAKSLEIDATVHKTDTADGLAKLAALVADIASKVENNGLS